MTDDDHDPIATPDPQAEAPSQAGWQAELDPELGRFVEQKGWRSASDAVTSYRHLERLVGGDRLNLPGTDAGPEAWAPIWDRLGRPQDADGYDLPVPDGDAYDAELAGWYRETAHRLGLTRTQARDLHDAFLARLPAAGAPLSAAAAPAPLPDTDPVGDLQALWGRQYDANMQSARRAYAALLGDAAPFHDIADALGETALMQLLAKAGRLLAEDSITARAGAGAGPRNPAEALQEIAKLQRQAQADSTHPYLNKTHPEHQSLVQRMEALYALAYGGS